ncbi:terminase large subunit [Pseudomonas aeruginosa]|uniref:terminase large subunit n=1 Tax=Pseudomonas aeruginosa TaxID=287 RepID=UPI0029011678|nr:terminase large subunit [Pseudomonas aeruginosa]MDU0543047.1 terminase large subunit [Pseudomonas aeruginosa]
MPEWSTACPDWAARLQRGDSIIPPPIFPAEAEAALDVMRELRIVDAPGSPKINDACGKWIFDLAAAIFGSYDAESGHRLIKEFFVMLPKKNFKSGLAASIMLTSLVRNWRQSAEFTILAPTKEVADNSFGPARDMVSYQDEDEPNELEDLIHVQSHIKTLTHHGKGATMKVIAADSNTAAGKKSVGTLIDELHLFGKQPHAKEMFREALGGMASRPEGFVIWLTTQSDEPPAGVFREKLQYARDVRDGVVHDPQFLPVIYEHPPEMVARKEHLLLENLAMVNPNLGYSVAWEFLDREYRKAKIEGEDSFRGFMAKHGNVEIGLALRSDRWAGADFWEDAVEPCWLEQMLDRCEVIDLGIDGGGLDDLLGAYAIGREKDTGKKLGWGHAWAHPSVLERRKEIAPALQDFAKAGHLTLVKRVGDDVDELADIAEQIHEAGLLDKIGCDPVGLGAILDKLEERGIPNDKIVGVSQGWKLGGAIKTAERWLAEGSFAPADQPMMAWCVGNARVEPRANSILITKQASGSAKIDPLMAMFNAVTLMALNPAAATKKFQIFVLG